MRRDFKQQLSKASGGASTETLKHGPIEPGWLLAVQRTGARDRTTAFTTLRIVVRGHGYDHLISEEASPVANELYWDDQPFFVREGETVEVDFVGTTASDLLDAYLTGFEEGVG